ncbi:hypothetical protein U1701_00305 [Sphingomonas sp. PB2P19]|uniref:hypothetical protein n=1 Tax=Sphingomonas rhamnosi TaxID=3096156 RepID=UPI002FC61AAE
MGFGFKNFGATVAAAALVIAPTAASAAANPAASLSLNKARAGTPTAKGASTLTGSTATFVNIGILAGLVAIVLVATGGSDDDSDSN